VELDREAGESVLRVKGEVHKKTSVGSTRFKQKNENRSKCIRLCNKWYIIYEM